MLRRSAFSNYGTHNKICRVNFYKTGWYIAPFSHANKNFCTTATIKDDSCDKNRKHDLVANRREIDNEFDRKIDRKIDRKMEEIRWNNKIFRGNIIMRSFVFIVASMYILCYIYGHNESCERILTLGLICCVYAILQIVNIIV